MISFRATICLIGGLIVLACSADAQQRFYKGNTHAHSLRSDGNDFPEMVIDYYHRNGYDFACLSEHDTMSDEPMWRSLAFIEGEQRVSLEQVLARYEARFGTDWVVRDMIDGEESIRIRPLSEFRGEFEGDGNFLILASEEITDESAAGAVHINALNLESVILPRLDTSLTSQQVMQNVLDDVAAQERATGRRILSHLNHPNFKWGVSADDLAMVTGIRFFEVYNGHPSVRQLGDADHPSVERMWDMANARRIAEYGADPLFGFASDDAHSYDAGTRTPGRGWIMVEADALTPEALLAAIDRGDFYASTGVTFKALNFWPATRTVEFEIEPDGEATFTSQLIGTRRDPDDDATNGSPQVGEVFASQTGRQVSFSLPDDVLYARVTVTSSADHPNPSFEGQVKQAWTQPVGWRSSSQLAGGTGVLSNMSTNADVGVNGLTSGFVVSGGDRRVLVRAVGPGMSRFGVTGVLADPILEIWRTGEDTPLWVADNWSDAPNVADLTHVAGVVGAFPIDEGSADAAALLVLPPGIYTVTVRGVDGTTGRALIEVYVVE